MLKEDEGVRREEDFIPSETNYKEMLLFMLNKKFEAIYLNRVNVEKKEQARLKKQHEREEKKKKSTIKNKNATQENEVPNTDMERLLKTFKHLVSKRGIIEDNIVNKNDFIIEANKQALCIVVIGKPRSGKSKVATDLSKSLDLVHVCVKTYINKVLAKVANYEPPEDLEEGQEPPKFLSELEEEIHQTLLVGKGPDDEQQVKLLAEMIQSAEAQTKGFVLDLPLHPRKETWYETISKGDLSLKSEDISYIIELDMSDTDIKIRAGGIKFDPETGEIVSKWERDERRKPKKKKRTDEDGEGEEDEEEEEPEEDPDDPDAPRKPKVLEEDKVLTRVKDLKDRLEDELQNYNSVEAPAFEKLIKPLYHSQYIKLNSAGLKPEVINEALVARIKGENTLLRPIAIPLEAEGDNKSYLTSGKEEGELPRRWSIWKQTDPVSLSQGKVVEGQTDFAASFNDRVFLFESEENQKEFCSEPKKFLNKSPEMPEKFRLLLAGPTGSGKQTVATELSDKYGWKIVDWHKLVSDKMQMMRERAEFLPNNPLAEDYKIGMSEDEWKLILEGKGYDAANFLPWLYEYLDLETEKRRPPVQPEGEGELDEEALTKIEEEKKKQEELEKEKEKEREKLRKKKEKEKKKKKKDKEPNDEAEGEGEEEEEEEPLEDIPLDQLDLKVEDEETLKKPFVGGFILIGFPQTAEHVEKLKAAEIGFDKIIYLNDTDEENPGAELQKRMKDDEYYDLQAQLENSERHVGILREHYEDQVNEISCDGTVEEVMARVFAAIDPFFTQIDNTDNVRTTDELGEEDKQLPRGEYGDFCPVTLTKDSWLFPGSEEFEAQVDERVYRLAGETELEIFKADPKKYIQEDVQRPPEPHIMIIGPRGSGVTTQIEILCEKYKVQQFLLKEEFLRKLKEKKEERKTQRLLERGFKAPEPVEDEEEGPQPDPEIEDDPEDFDKEAHEREVLREILDANSVLIIDGDWFDLPEDEVTMQYTDMIFDARRPPELVINLSVTEEKMLKRLLDNDAIEAEYQDLVDKRNAEKRQKKEEDRQTKLAELQEDEEKTPEEIQHEIEEWDKERDQEDVDDDDPDAPNLEQMLEEQKEKLVESRTTQSEFLEEFVEKVTEKKIPVINIDGDLQVDRVNLRILAGLKPYIEERNSMFERSQIIDLKTEEVKFYENSYLFSLSKYGYNSLFDIGRPDMNKDHCLVYRDQLYFFFDQDEKEEFMKRPDANCKTKSVPKDVWLKPSCFVLGTPSCGKSTACQRISNRTSLVHLKVEEIIPEFIESNCLLGQQLREEIKGGQKVSESLMVELIVKRVQYADCVQHGYLLEDFPKTAQQSLMLSESGIIPDFIFYLNMYSEYCYSRVEDLSNEEFMYDTRVFSERLTIHLRENPGVMAYYEKHFGNIKYINGLKSKWYVEDTIVDHIGDSIASKSEFAKNILDDSEACSLENINIDRDLYNLCHSDFGYYCPTTWKNHQLFENCEHKEETVVLFKHPNSSIQNLYFFRNIEQRDVFMKSPKVFSDQSLFPPTDEIPKLIHPHNAAQIVTTEKNLANYCPVTLHEEDKVKKGYLLYLVFHKGNF